MHPVISQALNLFRQGIISQAQLDKLTAQYAPQQAPTPATSPGVGQAVQPAQPWWQDQPNPQAVNIAGGIRG